MRILVADDEPLVRLGIISMIKELFPHAHEFLEAENGQDMIDKAKSQPDLAFVDIKMPLMNGIEAIGRAKGASPRTKWVLVTGFSDFTYAQQAIRLGVSDYLLKPVSQAQLAKVLNSVAQERQTLRLDNNRRFQTEIKAYFYQMDLLETDMMGMGQANVPQTPPGQEYAIFLCIIDCADHGERKRYIGRLLEQLSLAAGGQEGVLHAAFIPPFFEPCLVTRGIPGQYAWIHEAVSRVWRESEYPLTVFIDRAADCRELYAAYERIGTLSVLRAVYGFGAMREMKRIELHNDLEGLLSLARHVEQVCLTYLERDELAFRKAVGALQSAAQSPPDDVEMSSVLRYLSNAAGLRLEGDTLSALATILLGRAQALRRQHTGAGEIVSKIQAYVAQHYMDDIGIGTLADLLDITPNYLSKIFHQYAGCKFVTYLSRVRIDAAKQMLISHRNVSIKEVSEAVGYQNPRHFAKVFAKETGKPPSVFQSEN